MLLPVCFTSGTDGTPPGALVISPLFAQFGPEREAIICFVFMT